MCRRQQVEVPATGAGGRQSPKWQLPEGLQVLIHDESAASCLVSSSPSQMYTQRAEEPWVVVVISHACSLSKTLPVSRWSNSSTHSHRWVLYLLGCVEENPKSVQQKKIDGSTDHSLFDRSPCTHPDILSNWCHSYTLRSWSSQNQAMVGLSEATPSHLGNIWWGIIRSSKSTPL